MKNKVLLLLCCTLIVALSCSQFKQEDDFATITFYIGDVKKNTQEARIGEILKENDKIVTGINSTCDIKIGDSIIRIKEKSVMLISKMLRQGQLENVTLGLDIGKMLCKPKKLLKDERFYVKTPTAVAGVRGTRFTVEADANKTTRIKVFDGKVRVAKRIDRLENRVGVERVIEEATQLEESQKVVITEKDVKQAEKNVNKILQEQESGGAEISADKVISQVKTEIAIAKQDVKQFKIEDFRQEREEIISVKERPKEIIKRIQRVVRREREAPQPDGSLLVTRNEIYFIKDGRVELERKVFNAPVIKDGTLFIASQDFVFSASVDGPVKWRKKVKNDGKVELKGNTLSVFSEGREKKLNIQTGETE